ncbi:MAG TPA: inositol monophosphatase [Ruminococcus sp.]|jgi:myo-inositol-1(or 4)-monophosphatase|uniref:inositol monophosphatase family protein n=1 Tax=Ruminococcus bromii TaxID=40518 RepID=UPI000E7F172A|nr:inositol monophosphatase family protein [Ruminococcus sp.]HBA02083.1 inositol monophosphatase [Ruminococcus sp.]
MNYKSVESLVLDTKKIILDKTTPSVSIKAKNDFVTDIDIAISDFLKTKLKEIDPTVGFFSEEEEGNLQDNCWILDPIDGTTNLIYGYNLSSVSLGHYLDGEVVYGIVYNPFTEEIFTAERGKGAFLNHKKRLKVSTRNIDESLIEFGAGSTHKEFTDENFNLVKKIFEQCVDVRRICSSALDLCYIASGRIDGYFERILKPWDIAAGSLILEEAGGIITDYFGNPVQFAKQSSVIASNGVIQNFLIGTINQN